MQAADTLLGRVTYQGFAATFAESTSPDAEAMNAYRKYVISTTLERADWNNSSLIRGNVVEEVTRLKQQQEGQDIGMSGSGTLVQFLLRHNLIDELNLPVYPVVLGRGKRLFEEWDQPEPEAHAEYNLPL